MSISELNSLFQADFVQTLAGIYESSPWVAEEALKRRPFESLDHLSDALRAIVDGAPPDRKLDLIRAHPDLGGRLARRGLLTPESTGEQASLGLDRLDDAEFELFSTLNATYRERFGFPFVICVGRSDRAGILASFRRRLENATDEEMAEALRQIHLIAGLRLTQKFDD